MQLIKLDEIALGLLGEDTFVIIMKSGRHDYAFAVQQQDVAVLADELARIEKIARANTRCESEHRHKEYQRRGFSSCPVCCSPL